LAGPFEDIPVGKEAQFMDYEVRLHLTLLPQKQRVNSIYKHA
jgi:2-keto-4-pentenoate hydratase/2-oxohepta-3-ene-1,7-dioic acid hydratase in catechol pathway